MFYNRIIITPLLQNPYKIVSIIIFVTTKYIFPNYIPIVMCIKHLFNNSIIHLFYRTQVLPTAQEIF